MRLHFKHFAMKTKIYILVLVFLAIMGFLNAQTGVMITPCVSKTSGPELRNTCSDQLPLNLAITHQEMQLFNIPK